MSDLITQKTQPSAISEGTISRQSQEVQAAMTVAKRFPRDEQASISRILTACKRQRLAENAIYSYPKGGQKVTGPSIRLAETLAQSWGNLDFGVVELEQRDGESDVMTYCWDLETNTRQTKVFTVRHRRKARGSYTDLDDPRDIYELVANQGARRLRACILGVIPGDVQDLAIEACHKTLAGDGSVPLVDRVRKMVAAFGEIGVTSKMIETRLGHKLDACDETELVSLRSIYSSLRDEMSKREDWFTVAPVNDSHVKQATRTRDAAPVASEQVEAAEEPRSEPEAAQVKHVADLDETVALIRCATGIREVDEIENEYRITHIMNDHDDLRLEAAVAETKEQIRASRGGRGA